MNTHGDAAEAWRRIVSEAEETGRSFEARVSSRVGGFLEETGPGVRLPPIPDELVWLDGSVPGVRLVREIGRGGMGVVYEGVEEQTGRRVAVKLLHADRRTPSLVRRLKREAEALSRVDHPGIARLHSAGVCQGPMLGAPYLAMELAIGADPIEHAEKHGLGPRERAELAARIADVVGAAHRNGVLHLDLKPSNIAVLPDGSVKLLDFGIAKILDEAPGEHTLSFVTHPFGTIGSMAPEQADGRMGSPASDVYAIGVLMYRLLTGRSPIDLGGVPMAEAARRLSEFEPPRPRTVDRSIPRDLDVIVSVALARDPRDRYPDAGSLAADLGRFLRDEPVLARPVGVVGQGYRLVKRHPRVAVGVAAAMILLSGLSVVATVFALRANAAAERASLSEARATERFDDIAELAGTAIFELHDAIEDLPGSTAARAVLLEQAREYLDRLTEDPDADDAFRLKIAEGLIRITRLYGASGGAHLGDVTVAKRMVDRAQAIMESLDPATRKTYSARHLAVEILHERNRVIYRPEEMSQEEWDQNWIDPILRESTLLHAEFPDSPDAQYYKADTLFHVGRVALYNGDHQSAMRTLREAFELLDTASSAKTSRTGRELQTGPIIGRANTAYWLMVNEFDGAGELLETADRIARERISERPWSVNYQRAHASVLSYQARHLAEIGEYQRALDAARQSRDIAVSMFEIDPSNRQAHRAISVADFYVAYALLAWTKDETLPIAIRIFRAQEAIHAAAIAVESIDDRIRRGWLHPWEAHYPATVRAIEGEARSIIAELESNTSTRGPITGSD